MQSRDRVLTFIIISAITIIQFFISSTTNSINVFINIRFFRLEIELIAHDYYNFQRFINRVYNREIIITLIILISKQRINNSIYINLKVFIDEMKENVISHNRKVLKNAKMKLLNKYYKSHYIQKWKNDNFEHKWKKLNIKSNIKRDLINNVRTFKRKQL